MPETCRVVISIKLEFSASVGLIYKESITMQGHTIVNFTEMSIGTQLNKNFLVCGTPGSSLPLSKTFATVSYTLFVCNSY